MKVNSAFKGLLAALGVVTIVSACATTTVEPVTGEWQLQQVEAPPLAAVVWLSWSGDGKVNGFAGCNRFGGNYQQEGAALTVSELRSTRKACAEDVMQQEMRFLNLLGNAATTEQTGDRLTLKTGEGETLQFSRRAKP